MVDAFCYVGAERLEHLIGALELVTRDFFLAIDVLLEADDAVKHLLMFLLKLGIEPRDGFNRVLGELVSASLNNSVQMLHLAGEVLVVLGQIFTSRCRLANFGPGGDRVGVCLTVHTGHAAGRPAGSFDPTSLRVDTCKRHTDRNTVGRAVLV